MSNGAIDWYLRGKSDGAAVYARLANELSGDPAWESFEQADAQGLEMVELHLIGVSADEVHDAYLDACQLFQLPLLRDVSLTTTCYAECLFDARKLESVS